VKEAQLLDPSVRISLEVSHEVRTYPLISPNHPLMSVCCCKALCDSGIDYRGSNTGVFYAQLLNSAEDLEDDRYEINSYHGVGRPIAIRPNRISFTFDLRGQSIALDTACSSAATAIHLAMSAISLGDIDQALVVGMYVFFFLYGFCSCKETELLKRWKYHH
jgi:acyl transferase domain-containing protein